MQPQVKPQNPNFSSGPCSKRPGYDVAKLPIHTLGRSHRSSIGKEALGYACSKTAELLGLPEGYRVGVVPGSDTGAVEMAMWSLLGPRPVDVCGWESFGLGWVTDITKQLKLENTRIFKAEYGELPALEEVNFAHDVVFTWNGTTSGVKVKNGDWIPDNREGLTICDATSAVFAMEMPWEKLDVVTFSWQKVLGGEGSHGRHDHHQHLRAQDQFDEVHHWGTCLGETESSIRKLAQYLKLIIFRITSRPHVIHAPAAMSMNWPILVEKSSMM